MSLSSHYEKEYNLSKLELLIWDEQSTVKSMASDENSLKNAREIVISIIEKLVLEDNCEVFFNERSDLKNKQRDFKRFNFEC